MTDLINNEIFEEVESLLMDQSVSIQGNGLSYDIESFQRVRKFLNLLNDKYHTGLGVVEGKYKIKGFSEQEVERVYKEATGQSAKYGEILKEMQLLIFFLDEIKIRGAPIFSELHKKATKFSKFLTDMHETKVGKQHNQLLKEVETKFNDFYQVLEFYIQDSIGYKPYSYKQDSDMEDTQVVDFTTKLLEISNLLKSIRVVENNGLPKLMQKYIDILSQKHIDRQQWETIVRIINKFPIHIQGKNMKPEELREYLMQISSFVMLNQSNDAKDEFVQKLKILFQKVLDKKMEGGNRIVDEQQRLEYKRKIAVEIFRFNIQGYYSQIFTHFNQLIQQKHMQNIHDMSGSLRNIIQELKEIFTLMQDSSFLEQDLRAFIDILRKEEDIMETESFKQGLRFKFTYLKQQLDNAIQQNNSDEKAPFVQEFVDYLKKISGVFQGLINYLKSLEHKDFDITDMEITEFSRNQAPHSLQITNDLDQLITIVQQFINTSYMYSNIKRTQKEMQTVNLDKYQDESIKIFIQAKNDMQKYYADIQAFYAKEDVIYNPTLALYMKEILLKFHSCLYISNGTSVNVHLNPRYIVGCYNAAGGFIDRVAQNPQVPRLDVHGNRVNDAAGNPIMLDRRPGNISVPNHLRDYVFVGLTEELGAKQFKNRGFSPAAADIANYTENMPSLPANLHTIQNNFDESQSEVNTKYTQLQNYGDLFDIIKTRAVPADQQIIVNYIIKKQTYNQQQMQRIKLIPRENRQYDQNKLLAFLTRVQTRDPPGNVVQNVYLSLPNVSLKEYLLPEIQVPFMQPLSHFRHVDGIQPGVITNQPHTNFYIFDHTRYLPGTYLRELNTQYDDPEQYAHLAQLYSGANVLRQLVTYAHGNINDTLYSLAIPSMFGVQNSLPIMYTPKGILGTSFSQETQGRLEVLRSACDLHIWSLFDRVNPDQFNAHGNNIDVMLTPATADIPGLAGKQHSTIFPIHPRSSCANICDSYDCITLRNETNQIVEYYMYMAQHLQYFGLQGQVGIFDPMVRKQIFNIANKVYMGQDILPGIGPLIISSQPLTPAGFQGNPFTAGVIDQSNLYFNLTRPFGRCRLIDPLRTRVRNNLRPMLDADSVAETVSQPENSQLQFHCGIGLHKKVPVDILESQPRVPIPIILQKGRSSNTYRNEFIDQCMLINPNLIENGILRVNKDTIDQLLQVVDKHQYFRCYLSECIKIQYFNNYMLMQKQPQLTAQQVAIRDTDIENRKAAFMDLVRQVIHIKQLGNAALIVLTDAINKSINDQLKVVGENKVDYKTLMEQINSLIMIYRQSSNPGGNVPPNHDYFGGQLTAEDITLLSTGSKFLNNYVHNNNKNSNFYDNKHEMVGGNKNFDEYFKTMQKYIQVIKQVPHNMPIIENFTSLFSLIANSEGSANNINKDTIKRLVSEYIIASMVDISESVLEFDFHVSLKSDQNALVPAGGLQIKDMQLTVDTRENKKLKLITPDCIFVPFEYRKSSSLVPQFASLVTRDFDQLFCQLMNAMSQRMINHVSMYQLMHKKQYQDKSMVVGRIMLGSKKRNKSQSSKVLENSLSSFNYRSKDTLNLQDRDTPLDQNKFEMYFRVFLLIKYYEKLFAKLKEDINEVNGDSGKFINYYFQTDQTKNEGKLFTLVSKMGDNSASPEMLKKFIDFLNKVVRQNQLTSNDSVYSHIVSFVNQSFGVASNTDIQLLNNKPALTASTVTVSSFFNQTETPIHDLGTTDPRLASLSQLLNKEDDPKNTIYIHINNLIKTTVQHLQMVTEKQLKTDTTEYNQISKYIKAQYGLLKIKNSTPAEYLNGLLYIFNNYQNQSIDNIQTPFICHEQLVFAIEIYNQIWVALKLQEEMKLIDENDHLTFNNAAGDMLVHAELEANKKVFHKFIDKLADIYSVLPSNLVRTTLKSVDLGIPANLPAPYIAPAPNQLNFEQFQRLFTTVNKDQLKVKLQQLKNIITTLMSGTQFKTHMNHILGVAAPRPGAPVPAIDINTILLGDANFDTFEQRGMGAIEQNSYATLKYADPKFFNLDNAEHNPNYKHMVNQRYIEQKQDANMEFIQVKSQSKPPIKPSIKPQQVIHNNDEIINIINQFTKDHQIKHPFIVTLKEIDFDLNGQVTLKKVSLIHQIELKNDRGLNLKNDHKLNLQLGNPEYFLEALQQTQPELANEIDFLTKDASDAGRNLFMIMDPKKYNNENGDVAPNTRILLVRSDLDVNGLEDKLQYKNKNDKDQGKILDISAEGRNNMKGRGLGDPAFPIAGTIVQNLTIRPNPIKLQLQEDFMNDNYIVYTAYKQDLNEIFVFNRIIKEFFASCGQLVGHTDLLGKLFSDAVQEFRANSVQYQQVHHREIRFTKINVKQAMLQIDQGIPPNPVNERLRALQHPDNRNPRNLMEQTTSIQVRENAVTYQEFVNNVLYDGYNTKTDEFTFMETELHNTKQLHDDQVLNVSLFTSSILNFFMQWNLQQELSKMQPVDLLTQLNMKFNHEDLQVLVSNAVFSKFQLVNFMKKLQFKMQLLRQLSKNLFDTNQRTQDVDYKNDLIAIRKSLMIKEQLLQKLINFIQHKIIFALDIIINNKHSVLPAILTTGRTGVVQQPLLSNLKFLFQYKQQLQKLHRGALQQETDVFKLTFAKYLYTAMHDSENMNQLLKSEGQFDYVTRFHGLITDMAAGMYSLQNTILNNESHLSKALLFIPRIELLKNNPEQMNNVIVNSKYLKIFDVQQNLADLQRYLQYLQQNLSDIRKIVAVLYEGELLRVNTIENIVDYMAFAQFSVINPELGRYIGQSNIIKLDYIKLFTNIAVNLQPVLRPANPVNPNINDANLYNNRSLDRKQQLLDRENAFIMEIIPKYVYIHQQVPNVGVMQYDVNNLPISVFGVHLPSLLYQNRKELPLEQCIPSNNPLIFEQIIDYMSPQTARGDLLEQNIIQMGIVPLNMNMLRRDTGLVNISLYANTFQQFLNQFNGHERVAGILANAADRQTFLKGRYPDFFNGSSIDLGINKMLGIPIAGIAGIDDRRNLPNLGNPPHVPINDFKLPQRAILENIVNQGISVMSRGQDFITKFDMINQSMQFRVALTLYLILNKMLGGVLVDDKDVRLKGIEAIFTGQLFDSALKHRQY